MNNTVQWFFIGLEIYAALAGLFLAFFYSATRKVEPKIEKK